MITDQLIAFLPPGTNQAILGAAVRSNIIDLLTIGQGITPADGNVIIGRATTFGADMGIGGVKPLVQCAVGTTFADGTSLNVAFQGAEDNGSGSPGSWQTFIETGEILTANLVAGSVFGRFDFPPEYPVGFQPRFLSLLFTPTGVYTAGTVSSAVVTMGRPDQANKYAAGNFAVAG